MNNNICKNKSPDITLILSLTSLTSLSQILFSERDNVGSRKIKVDLMKETRAEQVKMS